MSTANIIMKFPTGEGIYVTFSTRSGEPMTYFYSFSHNPRCAGIMTGDDPTWYYGERSNGIAAAKGITDVIEAAAEIAVEL